MPMIVVVFYLGNWGVLYWSNKTKWQIWPPIFLNKPDLPSNFLLSAGSALQFFAVSRICPPMFLTKPDQTKQNSSNFFNKTKMFFLQFPSIFYFISHQYLLYQYSPFPLIHFTNIIEKTKRRVQCSTTRQERKKSLMNDQRMSTKI